MAEAVRRDPSLALCEEGRELRREMERAGASWAEGEAKSVEGKCEVWPESEEEPPDEECFETPSESADLSSANCMMREGRVEEALRIYKSAEDSPLVCAKRGMALLRLGRGKEAEEEGKKSLLLSPSCALAERVVGEALLRRGDGKGALKHIEAALALDPTEEGEELAKRAREAVNNIQEQTMSGSMPENMSRNMPSLESVLSGGEGVKEMVEAMTSNPECMKQITESPLFHQMMGSLAKR